MTKWARTDTSSKTENNKISSCAKHEPPISEHMLQLRSLLDCIPTIKIRLCQQKQKLHRQKTCNQHSNGMLQLRYANDKASRLERGYAFCSLFMRKRSLLLTRKVNEGSSVNLPPRSCQPRLSDLYWAYRQCAGTVYRCLQAGNYRLQQLLCDSLAVHSCLLIWKLWSGLLCCTAVLPFPVLFCGLPSR